VVSDSIAGNPFLFAGYFHDNETGLYHVRHRMYSPTLERWLQRDAAWIHPGGSYVYVANLPTVLADQWGLWPQKTFTARGLTSDYGILRYEYEYDDLPEEAQKRLFRLCDCDYWLNKSGDPCGVDRCNACLSCLTDFYPHIHKLDEFYCQKKGCEAWRQCWQDRKKWIEEEDNCPPLWKMPVGGYGSCEMPEWAGHVACELACEAACLLICHGTTGPVGGILCHAACTFGCLSLCSPSEAH